MSANAKKDMPLARNLSSDRIAMELTSLGYQLMNMRSVQKGDVEKFSKAKHVAVVFVASANTLRNKPGNLLEPRLITQPQIDATPPLSS